MTPNTPPRRAVFLDRDGTIAEEMGYMNHLSRLRVFPFSAEAIRRLNDAGLPVVVVTNQSGVARGFFPEDLIHQVHAHLAEELGAGGARIDAFYYCPHKGDDGCDCRKPRTGMLDRAAREHNLRLAGSWVVSDRYADLEMAHAAGAGGILVMTGYGRGEHAWNSNRWSHIPWRAAEDLTRAVDLILADAQKEPTT